MKKLMLGLMMAFAANVARAETIYNVEIDELKYTLDTDTKTAELEGYTGSPTKVDVGEVEYQGRKYIVTEVSLRAVPDCGSLTSVSLPNATTIGGFAFSGCGSLTSVSLPNATTIGDNAFSGCGSLTSVSLPNATTIGDNAFYGCGSLTSVLLPNAATIGGGAFDGCGSLTSVSLPNATTIGDKAFEGCSLTSVSFPNATTIGGYAFYRCQKLTSVSLPNATTIGNSAFYQCQKLTSVSLPNAMTFGEFAVSDCGSLTLVSLPNAKTIGEFAFSGCGSLTSLALPNAMMIGGYALSCAALSTLVVNPVMKSTIETNGRSEYGLSDSVEIIPAQGDFKYVLEGSVVVPKDRVIPEGHVAVTKESIAAAKAETVQIVNGQIELGVSVCSNADITASTANWAPVKFTKDTQIGLSADGTKLILPIPVAAQQGFMILQSGGAKAVPSDGGTSGFYMIKVAQ